MERQGKWNMHLNLLTKGAELQSCITQSDGGKGPQRIKTGLSTNSGQMGERAKGLRGIQQKGPLTASG